MTWQKRAFDLILVVLIGCLLMPVFCVLAGLILVLDGRPVFYISERMKTIDEGFALVKFRTMRPVASDGGVSGGDKEDRITRSGGFLRRYRLDEIPQVWNILRGHISFVGPRPPLRQYVDRYPDIYERVLRSRPGVTGLATVRFHQRENKVLAACTTAAQTDVVYTRYCIPKKAELDLIYQRNASVCYDLIIIKDTVLSVLR